MLKLEVQGGSREITVEQVVENIGSIFGRSGSDTLDGTKKWRLLWWTKIVDYTFGGPYFAQGKGFGVNLAESDGFELDIDEGLRSPHNGHLTILARAGVPGFLLWLAIHGVWFWTVGSAWWRAKLADQRRWMALFAWLSAVWIAGLVNASFDVFLEGPMGGIWIWTVVGAGLAASRLQRTHPTLLDAPEAPLPRSAPSPTAPRHAFRPAPSRPDPPEPSRQPTPSPVAWQW